MKKKTRAEIVKEGIEANIRHDLARNYNNKIKTRFIEEGLLGHLYEMLFPEILAFVENKFSAEALNALDKVIVRHTKYDWQKARKSELYLLRDMDTKPNAEVIKEALEALRIDITKDAELLEDVIDWLQSALNKNITEQDAIQAMEVALQGKGKHLGVLTLIEFRIASEYFDWFCFKYQEVTIAAIDIYSRWGLSLQYRLEEFLAKKRLESERAS